MVAEPSVAPRNGLVAGTFKILGESVKGKGRESANFGEKVYDLKTHDTTKKRPKTSTFHQMSAKDEGKAFLNKLFRFDVSFCRLNIILLMLQF